MSAPSDRSDPMRDAAQALEQGWGSRTTLEPLGSGRINDTWLARADRLVLQRINPRVFARPRELMANLTRVVAHLNGRAGGWVPELIATREGAWFFEDGGNFYRAWRFVEGEPRADDAIVRAAGRAFGRTQALLRDLPGPRLDDTIEGFLRLPRFLARLDEHARSGSDADVARLLERIEPHRALATRFTEPTGYIHGDCKLGNLLFARNGNLTAVLDLDTVMWGHWAWDFGDLVRSAAIRDGALALDRYADLVGGFLTGSDIAPDVDALVDAPRYVALILTVRYLTDHLEGDIHFKVLDRGDNLARAARQLEHLRTMWERRGDMRRIAARALAVR